jgi:predicted ATPase
MGNSVATKWVVITGPPCSGKTELLAEISSHGHRISKDVSRKVIYELVSGGKTIAEIKKDQLSLQNKIIQEMLEVENGLPTEELVFLEYALPCNLAFCEKENIYPNGLMDNAIKFRYKHIFFCEPFPYINDQIRGNDKSYQDQIADLLVKHYRALGYNVLFLPATNAEIRYKNVKRILQLTT